MKQVYKIVSSSSRNGKIDSLMKFLMIILLGFKYYQVDYSLERCYQKDMISLQKSWQRV